MSMSVCRICGKKYKSCSTPNTTNTFRWRDVACSVECGEKYLYNIQVSRGLIKPEPVAEVTETAKVQTTESKRTKASKAKAQITE